MYMICSFGRGDIVFIRDTYYIVKKLDEENRTITLIKLNGELAGVIFIMDFDEIVYKIENHYLGFGDLINSMCAKQKDALRDANNIISERNDEIEVLKGELQECYEIDAFKNAEIERLQKENLKSVNKDTFDKAVNDMLNNKDISTVEEVSAIMKLRSAIYY